MAESVPKFICVGSIIIDDIVYPDGRTQMEVLGGGGVHTAAGMRVWDERPALIACLGNGLSEAITNRLERDFDLRALVRLELPQARAWQIFEWDGKRTEIFRVEQIDPFMNDPQPEATPPVFRQCTSLVVLRDGEGFRRWRASFPEAVLFWEPEQAYMVAENRADFCRTLHLASIVSPNLLEAGLVYGLDEPERLVRAMLADGARIVVLRMGEAGSLIGAQDVADLFAVPAVPVSRVVDQTGAGNTYCGAFLVGWRRTQDLRTAGYYGAVAASFALESVGVLDTADPTLAEKRDQRLRWLSERAR